MRIEVLRAFIKVLETKSFTAAAEELFITQSALSKQIRNLEKQIGKKLLERTTRSVEPTENGRIFELHALRIVKEWDLLIEKLDGMQGAAKPRICIGYTASEQLTFILAGLNRKEWSGKGIEIQFCREDEGEIVTALNKSRIDCAVMHRPTLHSDAGMRVDCLAKSGIHAMISKQSPLAKRESLKLSEVNQQTDVRCLYSRDPHFYDAIDASFVEAGLSPPKRLETGESEEIEVLASRKGFMSLRPSIYPAWKGFVSIPITDCHANFDFLFVRCGSNANPRLDDLFATIHRAMQAHL